MTILVCPICSAEIYNYTYDKAIDKYVCQNCEVQSSREELLKWDKTKQYDLAI